MLQKLIYSFAFFCALQLTVAAQDIHACKEELKKSFTSMSSLYADTTQQLYLHYKIRSMDAETKKVEMDEIKLFKQSNVYIVTSSMSSYYSDKADAFLLMPYQKKLFQLDVQNVNAAAMANSLQVNLMRSVLIDSSVVESCTRIDDSKQKIVLIMPASINKSSQISRIDYTVDVLKHTITEYTIHYTNANSLVYMNFQFIEVKKEFQLPISTTSVRNSFLTDKNTLVSKYALYQYVDLRQIK